MFIVFRNAMDYMSILFENYKDDNVIVDDQFDGIIKTMNEFHNSISINRKINLPLKKMWYPFYLDYKRMDRLNDKEYLYFIFFEGNRLAYQKSYLNYLRKRYKQVKFIFRYINVINNYNAMYVDFVKKNYDMIISMEVKDCRNNNWVYLPNTYWVDCTSIEENNETDVLFLGGNKGRHGLLVEIYHKLNRLGLHCDFYIASVPEHEKKLELPGMHYINYMGYKEYLAKVKNAKCILELVSCYQSGSTLRAMEAIFFDKVLLTNNQYLHQEKYYDRRFMKIIEEDNLTQDMFTQQVKYKNKDLISHQILFDTVNKYFMGDRNGK